MYAIISVCLLLFLLLIIGRKLKWTALFERLAVIWFKLACAVMVLFIAHLILSTQGLIVPINIFSALTITFLGIPGILCITFVTVLLNN
ncbi:pro-sigmaK processing inhibitor BofA family protein [Solibacillus sp. CAU 1738]|uniref:pro-sigmaK processing inhibitor BofA family protein n=1 Tax=Solibacillus sp. CAU 1738 TaxID=3140363 RepID=UPI003260C9ED